MSAIWSSSGAEAGSNRCSESPPINVNGKSEVNLARRLSDSSSIYYRSASFDEAVRNVSSDVLSGKRYDKMFVFGVNDATPALLPGESSSGTESRSSQNQSSSDNPSQSSKIGNNDGHQVSETSVSAARRSTNTSRQTADYQCKPRAARRTHFYIQGSEDLDYLSDGADEIVDSFARHHCQHRSRTAGVGNK